MGMMGRRGMVKVLLRLILIPLINPISLFNAQTSHLVVTIKPCCAVKKPKSSKTLHFASHRSFCRERRICRSQVQKRHPESPDNFSEDPETGGAEALAKAVSKPPEHSPNGTLRGVSLSRCQCVDWEF
jgi:hypothetical protein